jgi:3-oxoacyl-[acyl-carrier protein] reductase
MTTLITDKICLITGGTRGIGRAIAEMLLRDGAQVVITGRDQTSVDKAVAEMAGAVGDKTRGKIEGRAADVRDHTQIAGLFEFVDRRFGGLDVLINNAGVGAFRNISELTIDEWKYTLETNLDGVFYCSREALARFQSRGGGYIVNISSLAGKNPFAGGAAYNASKFALTGFSEAMMLDKRNENVRVSYVMPGSVATDFGGSPVGGSDWKIQPEDIAEIIRMLLQMPERTLISRVEVRPSKPKR